MFALFACGACHQKLPSRLHPLESSSTLLTGFNSIATMADQMGDIITIDNFTAKMPKFDPTGTSKPLYGLVDMGR